ncbi:lipopolysaccharide biosynthesis protein [Pseudonocardia sichuanensis]
MVFWILAARLYDPGAVGLNSALVSSMTLLGAAAQLNLGNALLRFVPVAGGRTRGLVVACYAVAIAAAAVAGAVFALGSSWWSPLLHAAFGASHGESQLLAFFVVSTPLWTVFVIQDYVLPAIKRATAVPLENLAFSVLKILFLGGAAVLGMRCGIAVAWVGATALIVLITTVWLARLLPCRSSADSATPAFAVRDITSFIRADYAGSVFLQVAVFGLPLVVLTRLGAEAAAVYGITWQIAYAFYLVVDGMGQSLVAHVAADPDQLETARRSMIGKAMLLLVPGVLVCAVVAYPVLSLFGPFYADEGGLLLVLLALSAIPNAITWSTVWAARVRRDGRVLFWLPAAITSAVIGGSWLLMPVLGIVGTGVAWLGVQSVAAVGVLVVRARR